MELDTRDGITYRLVQSHHRRAVVDVIARAFVDEPATAHCTSGRPSLDDWVTVTDFFMDECVANGLSLVAMDGDNVAGAFINRDFFNPLPPGLGEYVAEPSNLAPGIAAIDAIDAAWIERRPEIDRTQLGRVVDLWMGGVYPAYRGRQIFNHLTDLSLQVVTEAGFDYAVIEATGAFSQAAMDRAGCQAVYSLPYTEFLWRGEAVFQNVPPPHSKWVIYEKKLR